MPLSFIFAYAHPVTQCNQQRRVRRAWKVLLANIEMQIIPSRQRMPLQSMSHSEKVNICRCRWLVSHCQTATSSLHGPYRRIINTCSYNNCLWRKIAVWQCNTSRYTQNSLAVKRRYALDQMASVRKLWDQRRQPRNGIGWWQKLW